LNPNATTQEVVDALASHGIVVSGTLVRTVKAKHNTRQAAKKAAKSVEAKGAANKPEVNKSQAIRDYFKMNKKAKTQEVMDALAAQGITVTANLVTTVKAKSKRRRRAVKAVVENVVAQGGGVGVPEIKAAFAFLKAAGSVEIAKQALAAAIDIKKIV
jgi:5-formyltetrahydrofolate cyclo-ligase